MKNSEGYSDPTAQAAFANIMREERKQRREEERKARREEERKARREEERKARREEERKERKQRYNNRPGAHKTPKGEKYRNATNKPISKTGGRKE